MIRFELILPDATSRYLDRLGNAATKPSTLQQIANAMLEATIDCFVRQESPLGDPWHALAPATLRQRRAKGIVSNEILYETGALFASLRAGVIGGNPTVTAGQGLPDPRARVHQDGTPTIPRRPFFPDDGQLPDRWANAVESVYADAWAAA